MRTKILLATVAAALLAAGAAFADNGNGPAKIRYSFLGQLTATPANGGVSITVEGGNRPALRAMLGQPVAQTFAYGSNTEFLKWSAGIPTVVQPGDLAAGDFVWVHVRAARGSALADIESQQAGLVGDRGAYRAGDILASRSARLVLCGQHPVEDQGRRPQLAADQSRSHPQDL